MSLVNYAATFALQPVVEDTAPIQPMHNKKVNKSDSNQRIATTHNTHQDNNVVSSKEAKKKSHNAFVSWIRKKFAKVTCL